MAVAAEDRIVDTPVALAPRSIDVVDAKEESKQAVPRIPPSRVLVDIIWNKSIADLMDKIGSGGNVKDSVVHSRSRNSEVVGVNKASVVLECKVLDPIRSVGESMVRWS